MRTSKNYDIPGQLTLFPQGFLANHIPMPVNAEEQTMIERCGQNAIELSESPGPLGQLSRMLLDSPLWGSTVQRLTWKKSVTKSGCILYRLQASARLIGEIDCGLLRGEELPIWERCPEGCEEFWCHIHDCHAYECKCPDIEGWDDQEIDPYEYRPVEIVTKPYPTPTATDCKHGVNYLGTERARMHTPLLRHMIAGPINPEFAEWLMGYPLGWTECEASETR